MNLRLTSITSLILFSAGLGAACSSANVPAGTDTRGEYTEVEGGVCVDIELSSYSQTCTTASDCALIAVGNICSTAGPCAACPSTPINSSGLAQYTSAISGLSITGTCECAGEPVPSCVHGTCTVCGLGSTDPACSSDAGAALDANVCVNVELSTYDQSCTTASDCVTITAGEICTDSCACGGSTINKSGQGRYDEQIASLDAHGGMGGVCHCPVEKVPECLHGTCTIP